MSENESGASLHRPELFRLLRDSKPGDILLTEQVDRLSRLSDKDWDQLKHEIKDKVVALDLTTSHMMMKTEDAFTGRMFDAIDGMLLDMLAAIARKDYDDRRLRQAQGIAKAKADGKDERVAPRTPSAMRPSWTCCARDRAGIPSRGPPTARARHSRSWQSALLLLINCTGVSLR